MAICNPSMVDRVYNWIYWRFTVSQFLFIFRAISVFLVVALGYHHICIFHLCFVYYELYLVLYRTPHHIVHCTPVKLELISCRLTFT